MVLLLQTNAVFKQSNCVLYLTVVEDNVTQMANVTYNVSVNYPTSSPIRATVRIEVKVRDEHQLGGYQLRLVRGDSKFVDLTFELKPTGN